MSGECITMDSNLPYWGERAFTDVKKDGVFHGFFGRRGGEDACADKIVLLNQVHGNLCVKVDDIWPQDQAPEADALISDVPGIALGIKTADCAPVLFYGKGAGGKPVVAAAHAGWKGALGGVLEVTVGAMKRYGVSASDIKACIGPCISRRSYEVSPEFFEIFIDNSIENERFFSSAQKAGHFMFDLPGFCAFRLYEAGVSRVSIKDIDTYSNADDFFSYRRATHTNESDYGRQISLVCIRDDR